MRINSFSIAIIYLYFPWVSIIALFLKARHNGGNNMKIVNIEEVKIRHGKKELNTPEKWLFDKEGKKVRLSMLRNLEEGKAAVVELSEFQTSKKSVRNFDWMLNQVFILGEIPLLARKSGDNEIVIKKLATFDLGEYNKGDKKDMSNNHKEFIQAKLAEVMA